ncbi:PRC-barrel domain-containing protein [Tianweitania sediminis]|uniref:PRC-barrel domain-containing protein n=1 Tax=Tianweitania sediminis TaxID=1502156 RepID=A0A8J7R5I9_9HYPH|nr:PRC-barrel domain-containing protein [Tianweitania sediminis]MBP0438117.1 PRC-barrel domain-containing protein [Tianweitania sediminis]
MTQPTGNTTEGAMQTTGASAEMQSQGGFITYQEGNQVLGSGLMGANIRGADGENIGTVDDLLLDRNGQVQAVVVGVGGFLGIGQKNVAIANDQLEFVLAQDAAAMSGDAGTAAAPAGTTPTAAAPAGGATTASTTNPDPAAVPADGTATGAATGTAPMAGTTTDTAATGNTGMTGTDMPTTDSRFGWSGAGLDHIQVSFTRQQLEDAPAFEAAE